MLVISPLSAMWAWWAKLDMDLNLGPGKYAWLWFKLGSFDWVDCNEWRHQSEQKNPLTVHCDIIANISTGSEWKQLLSEYSDIFNGELGLIHELVRLRFGETITPYRRIHSSVHDSLSQRRPEEIGWNNLMEHSDVHCHKEVWWHSDLYRSQTLE